MSLQYLPYLKNFLPNLTLHSTDVAFDEEDVKAILRQEEAQKIAYMLQFPFAGFLHSLQQKLINVLGQLLNALASSDCSIEKIHHLLLKIGRLNYEISHEIKVLKLQNHQMQLDQVKLEEALRAQQADEMAAKDKIKLLGELTREKEKEKLRAQQREILVAQKAECNRQIKELLNAYYLQMRVQKALKKLHPAEKIKHLVRSLGHYFGLHFSHEVGGMMVLKDPRIPNHQISVLFTPEGPRFASNFAGDQALLRELMFAYNQQVGSLQLDDTRPFSEWLAPSF